MIIVLIALAAYWLSDVLISAAELFSAPSIQRRARIFNA
jgi:hypothetical protein